MRHIGGWLIPLWLLSSACFYATKGQYDDAWDRDGDGWSIDEDCAPDDAAIHPAALDLRGDGCDADCGTELDSDGDDWPDVSDCAPDDPTIYPCAEDVDGDAIDSDCDNRDGPRTTACPAGEGEDLGPTCSHPALGVTP